MSNMTPREQIEKEENLRFPPIKSIANSIVKAGFKEGAEYGYNLAIENVVEWLKKDLIETKDRDGHPSIESRSCRTVDELINYLKQAMKL